MMEVTNFLATRQYIVRRGDETHKVKVVPQIASTLRKELTFWGNSQGLYSFKILPIDNQHYSDSEAENDSSEAEIDKLRRKLSSAENEKARCYRELEKIKRLAREELSQEKNEKFGADQARLEIEMERNELKRENEILKTKLAQVWDDPVSYLLMFFQNII